MNNLQSNNSAKARTQSTETANAELAIQSEQPAIPTLSSKSPANVHNDEAAPHMHVLVIALRDGKLQGSAILGGKAQIYSMRKDL